MIQIRKVYGNIATKGSIFGLKNMTIGAVCSTWTRRPGPFFGIDHVIMFYIYYIKNSRCFKNLMKRVPYRDNI